MSTSARSVPSRSELSGLGRFNLRLKAISRAKSMREARESREKPVCPADAEQRALLIALAKALHEAGAAAHRLEDAAAAAAAALGVEAAFFCTPTMLMLSFGDDTVLLRVRPSEIDLSRLWALDEIVDGLSQGRYDTAAARARLEGALAHPPPFSRGQVVLGFGLVSLCLAMPFGGGLAEMLAGGIAGLLVGAAAVRLPRYPVGARAFEAVAALLVTLYASALGALGLIAPVPVVLAALIVLFPGFSLTVAINELSARHLAAGTSRFMGAAMTLVQLGVGAAVAQSAAVKLGWAGMAAPVDTLPSWGDPIAVAAASVGAAILFQAPRFAVWHIVGACMVAYFGTRLGADLAGPGMGAALGALLTTLLANAYARVTKNPAVLLLVPALLLLVPGSVGYRGMLELVGRNTVVGLEAAFSMVLIAGALVTAMTVAHALLPPRKLL